MEKAFDATDGGAYLFRDRAEIDVSLLFSCVHDRLKDLTKVEVVCHCIVIFMFIRQTQKLTEVEVVYHCIFIYYL